MNCYFHQFTRIFTGVTNFTGSTDYTKLIKAVKISEIGEKWWELVLLKIVENSGSLDRHGLRIMELMLAIEVHYSIDVNLDSTVQWLSMIEPDLLASNMDCSNIN